MRRGQPHTQLGVALKFRPAAAYTARDETYLLALQNESNMLDVHDSNAP